MSTPKPWTADAFERLTGLDDVTAVLDQIEAAEAAITAAQQRHPHAANRLYHSFPLLVPTHKLMNTSAVYAAHCRELLDRVASGGDTRPGTAAEVCCALSEVSQLAPLRSTATGLYMRMWQAAGLPELPEFTEAGRHHEALEATRIDEHEQTSRRALAVADRLLDTIECAGRHHGQIVACAYALDPVPAQNQTIPADPPTA